MMLQIPALLVDKTVAKKIFRNSDLSKGDKTLLSEAVEKITWKYCLKNELIPIQPYADEVRDYPEVEVLEVSLAAGEGPAAADGDRHAGHSLPHAAGVPSGGAGAGLDGPPAAQPGRPGKGHPGGVCLYPLAAGGRPFWTALDIRELRFTNFFDFYTDWVDRLSVQNAQEKMQVSDELTGEEARQLWPGGNRWRRRSPPCGWS